MNLLSNLNDFCLSFSCIDLRAGASHPHSADDTTKDEELRQISDELEKLDNEIQHIKSNPAKVSATSKEM